MPIVSREQVYCNGVKWTRVVKCNAGGKFSIDLPPHYVDAFDKQTLTADTLKEVVKKWDTMCSDYDQRQSTTRKIILYELKINGYIEGPAKMLKLGDNRVGDPAKDIPNDIICLLEENDVGFCYGTGCIVEAAVYEERTTITPNGKPVIKMDKLRGDEQFPYGLSRGFDKRYYGNRIDGKVLEWTEARHQFFVNLQIALNHIIWSLSDLTDDAELIRVADSGTFLMGATHGQKELGAGQGQEQG